MDRFTHSSAPVKKVQAVQFGILDPDFVVSSAMTMAYSLYQCLSTLLMLHA